MCGITGILSKRAVGPITLHVTVRRMTATLVHRGPDGEGTWVDAERGIALGHRRLAIMDPSPQGSQPMTSACGRYVLVCNGEIYNHLALRAALGDLAWRGGSDTETLLACFTRYGVEATLPRLVGMFAFAVWDRQARSLTLARDRLGEKPLYWGHLPNGDMVFASELKALRVHPAWRGEIDRDALALYMRHNAVPAPHSVFKGIGKLRPGELVVVARDGSSQARRYWDLAAVAGQARRAPTALDDETAVDTLDGLLSRAVRGQMASDAPVGAFLSGGIDSSLVVAMMCRHSRHRVRTYAVGFREAGFDEAPFARAVARNLGTLHTEMTITADDARALLPELPRLYDEPFADASQIPTAIVSRLARREVKVALSGDGGDELFAGYNRYLLAGEVWPRLQRLPLAMRRAASRAITQVSPAAWGSLAAILPSRRLSGNVGGKMHKFARAVIPARSQDELYRSVMSHWGESGRIVLDAEMPQAFPARRPADLAHLSDVEFMSLIDQLTYLPDDILTKVDRAGMAAGLETRAPLLDHRLVEFAWQVPLHQKMRRGHGKWILRELLYRHVPRALVDRPKQGFMAPLQAWLAGPLRAWAEDLLDPALIRRQGLFDADEVGLRWNEHRAGTRNWQYELWDVLMFQAWLAEQGAERSVERDLALA